MNENRPKNFHEQIVETLGQRIVGGVYASGAQIPPEPLLAESLSVSRLAIREAMKTLAAKGLIIIRPKTGTHVLPRESWNLFDPKVLAWHASGTLDERFVTDLMELRRTIEPVAARLAAMRASEEQLELMRKAFAAMHSAPTQAAYITADLQFHGTVLAACDNQFIRQLQGALSEVLKTSFLASSAPWGKDERALALHQMLLGAVERHNGDAAAQAVENLIKRAEENILARFKTGRRPAPAKRAAARIK